MFLAELFPNRCYLAAIGEDTDAVLNCLREMAATMQDDATWASLVVRSIDWVRPPRPFTGKAEIHGYVDPCDGEPIIRCLVTILPDPKEGLSSLVADTSRWLYLVAQLSPAGIWSLDRLIVHAPEQPAPKPAREESEVTSEF